VLRDDSQVLTASIVILLLMEAVKTSETSDNFYETKCRYNPEGGHLHTLRLENLKSHKV
jgi:hypothetical protein